MVASTSLVNRHTTIVPPSPTQDPVATAVISADDVAYCMPTGIQTPILTSSDPPHDPTQPVRVACKARGIKDHTPSTAYLEIPANPTHGLVLMCSHPECQSTNRRFRYCSVCAQPVAKRNFIKRHDHGLLIDKGGRTIFPSDGDTYEEEVQQMPPAKRPRITHPEIHKDQAKKDAAKLAAPQTTPISPITALSVPVGPAPVSLAPPQDFVVSFPPPANSANQVPTSIVIPSSMLEVAPVLAVVAPPAPSAAALSQVSADDTYMEPGQLTAKERVWLELLHSRPTNPHDDNMCKWIKNVLETSQPIIPPETAMSAPAPAPVQRPLQAPLVAAPPTAPPQPPRLPSHQQPSTDEMMEELLRGGDCDDELREFLVAWDTPV